MLAFLVTSALAAQPWQVGPSPSASSTGKGFALSAHGAVAGEPKGGRVAVAFQPHKRLWFGADVAGGAGWRACPTCDRTAFSGAVRFLAIDSPVFKGAVWGSTQATQYNHQLTGGIAMELKIGRFAVDTSWPIIAREDVWGTLLDTPELGARWHWSKRNQTRLAVVGLNPELALTHRLRLGPVGLEGTARTLDGSPMLEAGIRFEL